MSQSPHVLISMGSHHSPKMPQQDYENIIVNYNIGMSASSDAAFFNQSILESHSSENPPSIYGFFSGRTSFTNPKSMQSIVSFFDKSPLIDFVICDFIVKQNGFDSYLYFHPQSQDDIPFFIHQRAIHHITFSEDPFVFQAQLQHMRAKNCPFFHIAEPLLTLDKSI